MNDLDRLRRRASRLRRRTLGLAIFAVALGSMGSTPGPAAPVAVHAPSTSLQLPIGKVGLDVDDANLEQKMGSVFSLVLQSGANNCYIEALGETPGEQGEIAFVVKPPTTKEGPYLVSLEKKGAITGALADCVSGIFKNFYHYADHPRFDSLQGTLHFAPQWIKTPPPPTEADLRAVLEEKYSTPTVVRIVKLTPLGVSHDVEDSEVFRRLSYDVELAFTTDGYESTCRHFETYKVFAAQPEKSSLGGSICESQARKKGDHTVDQVTIVYALALEPSVADHWRLAVR